MRSSLPSFSKRFDADDPRTDEQVVERASSSDPTVFEILMHRYNERLYRAVRACLREEATIDRVMHDAYVSAFRSISDRPTELSVATWLLRAAADGAAELSGGRFSEQAALGDERLDSIRPSLENASPAQAMVFNVEQTIDGLPGGARVVFVLRDVEGLHTWEIAEALRLTTDTVRVRLQRARRKMRRLLTADSTLLTPATFRLPSARSDRWVDDVLAVISPSR